MSIAIRPAEKRDIGAMAFIRAQRWGTQEPWVDRIGRYMSGERLAQQSLSNNAMFVADHLGTIRRIRPRERSTRTMEPFRSNRTG